MATRRGPDNTIRVAVNVTYTGVTLTNVFWMQCVAAVTPTQANVDAYTLAVGNAYKARFANRMSPNLTFASAKSTYFLPGGLAIESAQVLSGVGTNASGADAPNSCAFVISWLANVYWRGGKPRSYIGGLRTTDLTSAIAFSGAAIASMDGNAGLFLGDVNALTAGNITASSLGFVSFRHGNADRPVPLFFAYLGHRVHPRIGTQRRRLGHYLS
jgi:hypothetical protein